MGKKQPRKAFNIAGPNKVPRDGQLAAIIAAKKFCWRFDQIDWDGPFGWSKILTSDLARAVIPKLHDYESMTWAEIDGPSGSHSVDLDQLCKEARDRLSSLKMTHVEVLFSVRMTGPTRVWGVKDVAILRVLWWDPDHQVCPSLKKNT
ncbi:hypothetical protein NLM27_08925 [Bradyrhizobium sp. CCGB12]|uniref:hypothetical protein n=1 Tax=Bradyrhizobium sp. CCGB12 TaxID=2949632 RepID=UPI0020B3A288|nr:hypothetical protein [Bradyrhizobium sp. CCGB12]MCP3388895.1 hypothetical protein [Bradyrhizobium sp. CCGB12]